MTDAEKLILLDAGAKENGYCRIPGVGNRVEDSRVVWYSFGDDYGYDSREYAMNKNESLWFVRSGKGQPYTRMKKGYDPRRPK